MESWRDLSTSLTAYLRGRVASPIFGAYLAAWAVLNFRLLLVLLGDGSSEDKIHYIDTRLYVEWWHWLVYGLIYPLLAALLVVFGMPFANRWTTVFLRARDAETLRLLLAQQNEMPLTREEAANLRRQLLELRQNRLGEQNEAQERLTEQAAQIDLLLQENKKLKDQLTKKDVAHESDAAPASDEEKGSDRRDPYQLLESDFVGVPAQVKIPLVERGLSRTQAMALYAVRNGTRFNSGMLSKIMGLSDLHISLVLLDQLKGLRLVDKVIGGGMRDAYQINSIGRQALQAILDRGFSPPPLHQTTEED